MFTIQLRGIWQEDSIHTMFLDITLFEITTTSPKGLSVNNVLAETWYK